jgi:hypothetical protein
MSQQPDTAQPTAVPSEPAPGDPAAGEGAPVSEQVQRVTAGYTFDTPSIELGVLMEGGTPVPEAKVRISLSMLNRHGLVAGATGTGKTKTLQVMAEQVSAAGVAVFAADIKGDLSGIALPGEPNEKLLARTQKIGQDWQPQGCPTEFYSLGGVGQGVPLRATVTSFCCRRSSASMPPMSRRSGSCSTTPTRTTCCCSTSRTCANCSPSSPPTRPRPN